MSESNKTNQTHNSEEIQVSQERKSNVREQLTRLSDALQNVLSNLDANVETLRFLVEKVEKGTRIDFEFKAVIEKSGNSSSQSTKE